MKTSVNFDFDNGISAAVKDMILPLKNAGFFIYNIAPENTSEHYVVSQVAIPEYVGKEV